MRREYYKDTWNSDKVWEVTYLVGGFYLRQIVSGRQFGRGLRTTKSFIRSIGIFDMQRLQEG